MLTVETVLLVGTVLTVETVLLVETVESVGTVLLVDTVLSVETVVSEVVEVDSGTDSTTSIQPSSFVITSGMPALSEEFSAINLTGYLPGVSGAVNRK